MSFELKLSRLEEIAQINPMRRVTKGEQVPFIEMSDLPENFRDIKRSNVEFRVAKSAGAHFKNGDTLLARITPCLENGKTAQVNCLDVGVVGEGSTEFIVLCGIEPEDDDYIYYLCREPQFRKYAIGRMEGTSGRQRVSWQSIAAYEFSHTPPNERRASVKVLAVLDDRITLLRETNTTLEAIVGALFKSWFVDFDPVHAKQEGKKPEGIDETTAALFPDTFEETELGMVPSGWQFSTLSSLAAFQNGHAFKGSDWVEQGHPVIKIGNVKPLLIDFDGCSYVSPETVSVLDRFKLGRGDLLVGMTGYVGETGLVTRTEVTSYLNQRVGRIVTIKGLDDLGFVFAAVRQEKFKAYAESQSHGSAQANVSGADLMKFSVIIPSAQVLDIFNQVVGKLIEKIIGNYEEAKTLANLRDTLLPRLISGQLRVADDKEEIEKVSA